MTESMCSIDKNGVNQLNMLPKGSTDRRKAPNMATSPKYTVISSVSVKKYSKSSIGMDQVRIPGSDITTLITWRVFHLNITLHSANTGFQTLSISFITITHLKPAKILARLALSSQIDLLECRISHQFSSKPSSISTKKLPRW